MGCDPAIGEREDYEDGSWWVFLQDHPDAPLDSCSFDVDYTGRHNSLAPSYSTWRRFCDAAGIFDVWYGEHRPFDDKGRGIRESACPITPWVINRVNEALKEIDSLSSEDQRRLRWMHWWMNWAVENCKNPVYG